jgi:hypothetical protein
MTNFEALVKNNPQYVKELLAGLLTSDILKSALTGKLEHDICYKERDKREMDFLNAEYVAPVLDDIEKKYLSDVIRPFKNRVKTIRKAKCDGKYFIEINMKQNYDNACLPFFSTKSGMYKGMELNKRYTLNELGL